jgi:hypothetical protein
MQEVTMQTTEGPAAERWLTLTEAAGEMRLSVPTFLRHLQEGTLPYRGYKVGTGRSAHWRIERLPPDGSRA